LEASLISPLHLMFIYATKEVEVEVEEAVEADIL
jgi:hypothetical protein